HGFSVRHPGADGQEVAGSRRARAGAGGSSMADPIEQSTAAEGAPRPDGAPVRRTPPWRYALGMFGTSIPINMIKGSMILFYVDILGLDVRAYGVVMVIYAVIDAIDNPLLGHLSDGTRTRFGRRRPWLVVGAPLLAASM